MSNHDTHCSRQLRSPQETDRPFAAPATFAINPDCKVQVIDISNASFSRPDLASLLSGLKFIQEKQYPVRGAKDSGPGAPWACLPRGQYQRLRM